MKDITIASRKIGMHQVPFIIAEMSGNHNQSLSRALAIVEAAAQAGVAAIKLQTYTADTMTLDIKRDEFFIAREGSLWKDYSLYELYQKAYTPWEWHKPIFDRCEALGLIGFSTPFDVTAVDFLETLNVPCYKIASFEIVDIPLIRKVAATGKPIIMSTGMANAAEIDDAVRAAQESGCQDLVLLKCTSDYPAPAEESNILSIPHMRELFQCQTGLSDHTLGIGVAIASVALGATVVEKHFTLARADGGVDSAFSLEPVEMKMLVDETARVQKSLGTVHYGPTRTEQSSLVFRRSLYVVDNIKTGDILSEKNLRAIRPGLGLPPKYYEKLLGKKVNQNIKRGTPLRWEFID